MSFVLVLYYSRTGKTLKLAESISRGVESSGIEAKLRTVPSFSENKEQDTKHGPIYASPKDISECSGIALGSPTRFGGMASSLKFFLEQNASLWKDGALVDKPASVFTSSATLHGGQESTLLSMALPLLHHGVYLVGVPFTLESLNTTQTGGTPYGASHYAGIHNNNEISKDEDKIAFNLGSRLGRLALLTQK